MSLVTHDPTNCKNHIADSIKYDWFRKYITWQIRFVHMADGNQSD